jgi:hypothetical protein
MANTALGTSPAAAITARATSPVANFGAGSIASDPLAGAGSALRDTHVLGWGFNAPDGMAVAGDDLFVVNSPESGGGLVTELAVAPLPSIGGASQ